MYQKKKKGKAGESSRRREESDKQDAGGVVTGTTERLTTTGVDRGESRPRQKRGKNRRKKRRNAQRRSGSEKGARGRQSHVRKGDGGRTQERGDWRAVTSVSASAGTWGVGPKPTVAMSAKTPRRAERAR